MLSFADQRQFLLRDDAGEIPHVVADHFTDAIGIGRRRRRRTVQRGSDLRHGDLVDTLVSEGVFVAVRRRHKVTGSRRSNVLLAGLQLRGKRGTLALQRGQAGREVSGLIDDHLFTVEQLLQFFAAGGRFGHLSCTNVCQYLFLQQIQLFIDRLQVGTTGTALQLQRLQRFDLTV